MLFLFRTTDDAFTHTDEDTAPYYGAEGGIFIDDADQDGIGYHICPPFNKHIERASSGMQHPDAPSYNANRGQIHYLAIPYAKSVEDHLLDDADIAALTPLTVDFTNDMAATEPCVRSVFYNDGEGQYGYVVDSDMEEQHMVIANAMLQDQSGDSADLAMLPTTELDNVYFDLYSKDYTADSWRRDLRITANDLLDDLSTTNLQNDSLHLDDDSGSDIAYQIDPTNLSIFASRFVNTINARFLDSVFLDDLTMSDIPLFSQREDDKGEEIVSSPYYDGHTRSGEASYSNILVEDDYFTANYRNQTPDRLAATNDNRIVLSIGVHPSAIKVDPDGTGFFQPFESNQANFLKMDPAFYGLYYGGVANTTEPAFDYTSRHLAYINFDLVYELDIDEATQEIKDYDLVRIVSPFTLLRTSFFSADELADRRDNSETYTAVAASIADNVFRHNFTGTTANDEVQHFLPFGLYCRISSSSPPNSSCYNDSAQMLLPDPADTGNHARTIASPHNLHRGVLYLSNTTEYKPGTNAHNSLNDSALLERFMRLNNGTGGNNIDKISGSSNPVAPGVIGSYAYHSMLYNSFDRDHAYDYSYSSSSENFAATIDRDNDYSSNDGFEQEYWGLSPYAESPDARADQILPNAFMLGFNGATDYHHLLTNQPYQYTSFVQKIHPNLIDADKLADKNIALRGLDYDVAHDSSDQSWSGAGSLNLYPSYTFPASEAVTALNSTSYTYNTSAMNLSTVLPYRGSTQWINSAEFAHVLGAPANAHHSAVNYKIYETNLDTSFSYGAYLAHTVPSHFAGRSAGFYFARGWGGGISHNAYAVQEFMFPATKHTGESRTGLIYRADYGSALDTRTNYALAPVPASGDKTDYAAILYDDYYYSGNQGRQRMLMPHHADDFDFDRGQIMAHKLGFFVDNGIAMDLVPSTNSTSGTFYGQPYNRMFFPSDPAAITSATSDTDYVVEKFTSNAYGTVTNYYPLVQANESLHTNSGVWPVLLTRIEVQHRYNFDNIDPSHLHEMSGYYSNISSYLNTSVAYESRAPAIFPLSLDKIFPESYHYQLGFVNREELFMYDPTWDGSGDPLINRFYASAVGHFGYATQYSRLNRRSMQGYHLSTSSQFLGDHLARFSSTPTAGVHTPSDLDSVFAHTPASQGGTGTNYGSYGEGHYNLSTTADSSSSGSNWQHRTYDGTLRGYVLELRTNPFTDFLYDSYYSDSSYPAYDGAGTAGSYIGVQDLGTAGVHPDGNP